MMANRHSPEVIEMCFRLRGMGYTLLDIASVTGVSKSSVSYQLRKERNRRPVGVALGKVSFEMAREFEEMYRIHNPTDNDRIRDLLDKRFEIGKERYGHGFRVHDDTKTFGTETDSWLEMGVEEVLDMTLYLAAHLIRIFDLEAGSDDEE